MSESPLASSVPDNYLPGGDAAGAEHPTTTTNAGGGSKGVVPLRGSVHALALIYLDRRRKAGTINDHTAGVYRHRLIHFADNVPADPKRVTRRHIERWMEMQESFAPLYRRNGLSIVRGFFRWLVLEGYVPKDPTISVPMPTTVEQLPKRLTNEEATTLVRHVSHDLRSKLIVLLMLQEGLRRIEVARLEVGDIDFAERSMAVRGKGGQGQQTDALPISTETWACLTAYLAESGHRRGPLIQNRTRPGRGLLPQTISELVHNAMVESGIKAPGDATRTPHSCRHTAAHDMLSRTNNVRAVQQALRHRSVRSTEIYLRGHTAELREIMDGRRYSA